MNKLQVDTVLSDFQFALVSPIYCSLDSIIYNEDIERKQNSISRQQLCNFITHPVCVPRKENTALTLDLPLDFLNFSFFSLKSRDHYHFFLSILCSMHQLSNNAKEENQRDTNRKRISRTTLFLDDRTLCILYHKNFI